jgi:hypothetical protein
MAGSFRTSGGGADSLRGWAPKRFPATWLSREPFLKRLYRVPNQSSSHLDKRRASSFKPPTSNGRDRYTQDIGDFEFVQEEGLNVDCARAPRPKLAAGAARDVPLGALRILVILPAIL